jgi:hypothetical protein
MRNALKLTLIGLFVSTVFSSQANAADDNSIGNKPGYDHFRLSAGVDYSSGKYGDTRKTEVISLPVAVKYINGPISIKISVPFVHVRGPGSLLSTPEDRAGRSASSGSSSATSSSGSGTSGSGSSGSGTSGSGSSGSGSSGSGSSGSSGSGSSGSGSGSSGSTSGSSATSTGSAGGSATATQSLNSGTVIPGGTNRSQSGIGDVNVTLNYSFDFGQDVYLDLTGKVKLPTASKAKRFGTGKVDFVLAAELGKAFGAFDVYAGGRRRFAGNSIATRVRDTWGVSTGFGVKVKDGVRVGFDYDWQQASFTGGRGSSEVSGAINFRVAPKINLNLYAVTGLNAASVDFGSGAVLSYRF